MSFSCEKICFHDLLKDISLSFAAGKIYGILGPNGSGKTTWLRCLSYVWRCTSGTVAWNQKKLDTMTRLEISRAITLVPQTPQIPFDFKVEEMVAMGADLSGGSVEDALREVDGLKFKTRSITSLSAGERQRIYIARALATQAPVMLLDEPFTALDIKHELEIWALLERLKKSGKIVILTLHHLHHAKRYLDEIAVLNEGRLVTSGAYEALTPQILAQVFGVNGRLSLSYEHFLLDAQLP